MKSFFTYFILIILFFSGKTYSQQISEASIGNGFSIMPSVEYVSSASIQLYSNSRDVFLRGLTEQLDGGYGYGISLRKKFFRQDLSFGITTEYLKIFDDQLSELFESDSVRVRSRVTEELWIVPVEFTGYFNIPNFNEDINIYLGGGFGVYFGDRRRTIANLSTKTISRSPGYSLIVLSGFEVLMSEQFSGVFEVRFRQGEYSVISQFPSSTVTLNGRVYPLEQNLNSTVFVDGLKLSLGVAYHF